MTKEQAQKLVRMTYGDIAADDMEIVNHYRSINKDAMDEYAKQQAVAFHIFTLNEVWKYDSTNDTWHHYTWDSEGVSYYIVWDEFIEHQNKVNDQGRNT